jgi:hypothetical protein
MHRVLVLMLTVSFSSAAFGQVLGRNPVDGTIAAIWRSTNLSNGKFVPFEECALRAKLGDAVDSITFAPQMVLRAARRDFAGCVPATVRPQLLLLDWEATDTSVVVKTMLLVQDGRVMEDYHVQRIHSLYSLLSRRQWGYAYRH